MFQSKLNCILIIPVGLDCCPIPVESVAVGALVCCVAALNVSRAGLAVGVPNVNVGADPNAGADVVAAAWTPNEIDGVAVAVAGVPNDNELPVVEVAPIE